MCTRKFLYAILKGVFPYVLLPDEVYAYGYLGSLAHFSQLSHT